RADDCDPRAITFAARAQQPIQRERSFVCGHGQPRVLAAADDGVASVKSFNRLAELQGRAYRQEMIRVFEKARDMFGGEPAAQRKDQIVISETLLDSPARDNHVTLIRVVACDLRLQ